MKRVLFLVLAILLVVSSFALADDLKWSSSTVIYAYDPLMTPNGLYFELTPSIKATLGNLTFVLNADTTFNDASVFSLGLPGLDSGRVYLGVNYNFGFATAYVHPGIYKSGNFYWDILATFNIPHAPVTLEYYSTDVPGSLGTLVANVNINF